jgi:hypothetical protein
MALSTLVWKLASPYDAYVSHVARLESALERVRYFSSRAQGYEAGLRSSSGLNTAGVDPAARAETFRARLGAAAQELSDEDFEDFLAQLGGGNTADVEANRARVASRLGHTTRGLEEYFAIAGRELSLLEQRGYSPGRPDVARQLRDNHLPSSTVSDYRRQLHELGAKAGRSA